MLEAIESQTLLNERLGVDVRAWHPRMGKISQLGLERRNILGQGMISTRAPRLDR